MQSNSPGTPTVDGHGDLDNLARCVLQLVAQPVQALVQAVTGGSARGLEGKKRGLIKNPKTLDF